ncbi:hypothetical protein GTY89_31930 [Streptomyces sp. SID5471]|nr:hypothetical protein [Streptomyces sp. SID5471]
MRARPWPGRTHRRLPRHLAAAVRRRHGRPHPRGPGRTWRGARGGSGAAAAGGDLPGGRDRTGRALDGGRIRRAVRALRAGPARPCRCPWPGGERRRSARAGCRTGTDAGRGSARGVQPPRRHCPLRRLGTGRLPRGVRRARTRRRVRPSGARRTARDRRGGVRGRQRARNRRRAARRWPHVHARVPAPRPRQRLLVDWTLCQGHGLCADLVPGMVRLGADGYPERAAMPLPARMRRRAQLAVRRCPALALRIQDGT